MALLDVIILGIGILLYALTVNAFYQAVGRRVMVARVFDRLSEEEMEQALRHAKAATQETAAVAKAAKEGEATHEEVVEVAQEARAATAEVKHEAAKLRRDPLRRYGLHFVLYLPFAGAYFALLASNLVVLSEVPTLRIVQLSLATVLAVRAAAYVSEATSHDLAKMLPLSLLGFALISGGAIGVNVLEGLREALRAWPTILQGLAVLLVVEVLMFALHFAWRSTRTS